MLYSRLVIRTCKGILPLAVVCLLACAAPDSDRRIILITVDSLRPDRMAAYGASVSLTPSLDELAAESHVFLRAVTPAPLTLPALAGLMTGKAPSAVGVLDDEGSLLTGPHARLAPDLLTGGWSTGAFVNAPFLDHGSGIMEGFRHAYNPTASRESAGAHSPALFAGAVEFLDRNRKIPAFAWIHVHDTHYPYTGPDVVGAGRERYSAAVAAVDRALGAFLRALDRKGLSENAWIIVTADHGEGLGTDGEATHGVLLNDATLHVPLVIRPPGGGKQRNVEVPVTLLDLYPTVRALAGLEGSDAPGPMDGRSLLPVLQGDGAGGFPDDRPLYTETFMPLFNYHWPALRQVRRGASIEDAPASGGPWPLLPALPEADKVVRDETQRRRELAIAGEIASALETGRLEEAERLLAEWLGRPHVSPMAARLQATLRRIQGRPDEALTGLGEHASSLGTCADVWSTLAELQQDLGRPSAEAWSRAADAAGPRLRFRLQEAEMLAREGQMEAAVRSARKAVADRPASATVNAALGRVFLRAGSPEDALRMYAAAAVAAPGSSLYHREMAVAASRAGNTEGAIKMLQEAERIDPSDATLQRDLGDVHASSGDLEAARAAYRKALPAGLGEPGASLAVAENLLRVGRLDEAAALVDEVLAGHAGDAQAHYIRGQIELARREPESAREELLAALRTGGERPQVYYGLARAALMASDEEQALAYLDRVFAADDPVLRRALQADNLFSSPDRFPAVRVAVERYLAGAADKKGDVR